ncbi:MAG TPA: FadR/GntR family transcriptional regulator, partial [Alphaproteobacteria bacterium]|nr:FadR/GntR family transcriptional regulator [Alphaproteobacteria bacterium]
MIVPNQADHSENGDEPIGTAVDRVVDYVKARLLGGDLKPGDRLLPEREMSAALGVSRGSLREGLKALSLIGLVDIRHGQGTFVRQPDMKILRDVTTLAFAHLPSAISDAMQARIAIECQAIRLACERATDAEIDGIEGKLAILLDTLEDPVAGGLADHEFHSLIVSASHCVPLIGLYDAIVELLRPLHVERRRTTVHIAGIRDYLVEAHREVYLALLQRDPDAADRQ